MAGSDGTWAALFPDGGEGGKAVVHAMAREGAKVPSLDDTGHAVRLFATEASTVYPHSVRVVSTGARLSIPEGFIGLMIADPDGARSLGLSPAECVGIVSPRDEAVIEIAVANRSERLVSIEAGKAIARVILVVAPKISLVVDAE